MDRRTSTRLSKFLSLVLRHRPDEYGLRMDDLGFVDFDDLIDVLAAEDILGEDAERIVEDLVESSTRRRFEIREGRIRALYGHSDRVPLNLPEDEPPEVLYHGTTPAIARRAAEEGLAPAGRAYVHLSSTEGEALSVGRRHDDDPVLIEVDTFAAIEQGLKFHQATELIWLCPALPKEVCRVPEIPEREESAPPPAPANHGPRTEVSRPLGQTPPENPEPPREPRGFQRRTRKRVRR